MAMLAVTAMAPKNAIGNNAKVNFKACVYPCI
jgi:hypothetical protein